MAAPCELFIPLGELVDVEKELGRLNKDRQKMEKEIVRAQGMLNNPDFLQKAPEALVKAEQEKLATNRQVLASLEARIRELEEL